MNILHMTDCDSGGVPAVVAQLTSSLGGGVIFLGDTKAESVHEDSVVATLGYNRSINPAKVLLAIYRASKVVRRLSPDVLHAHSSFGGFIGAVCSVILRVPFVYSPHASPSMMPGASLRQKVFNVLERFTLSVAKVTLACSDDEKACLAAFVPDRRIWVIPNGVAAHLQDMVPVTQWDVLFVGRICAQKRPDLFAEIARSVKDRQSSISFAWVGPGQQVSDSNVIWLGEKSEDDVLKELGRSKVYLSVSDYEGLSLATLKAACLGCYLMLRDTPGNRAPVKMGAAGELFQSVEEVAKRIVEIVNQEGTWSVDSRCSRAAQSKDLFSVEKMILDTRAAYSSACKIQW